MLGVRIPNLVRSQNRGKLQSQNQLAFSVSIVAGMVTLRSFIGGRDVRLGVRRRWETGTCTTILIVCLSLVDPYLEDRLLCVRFRSEVSVVLPLRVLVVCLREAVTGLVVPLMEHLLGVLPFVVSLVVGGTTIALRLGESLGHVFLLVVLEFRL